MDKQLKEVLEGNEENYLLPFYWQCGTHRKKIPAQVEEIFQSGAKAFCVESRTHEDFCGTSWWEDMDIIFEEAEKRNMQVWVLDDKHFPSGYANGALEGKEHHLRKWFLREMHMDIIGPMENGTVLLPETDDILLGVFAFQRIDKSEALTGVPINLSQNIKDRWVEFQVRSGCWRVFMIYKSRKGGSRGHKDYIDFLNSESVDIFINAVYQPHYEHYKEKFGKSFAGFFSDEPSFASEFIDQWRIDYGMYNRTVGMAGLALPWNDEILDVIPQIYDLVALWYNVDDISPKIRYTYMESITGLYRDNFNYRIGNWCRAHGVMYIGHIIEDMNAHARLGCSTGHYFRSLEGQDMSGIDIVLHQVMPGFANYSTAASCSGGIVDPDFFHYVLPKLASSLAHITPNMKNRAMCEVFGAYGWAEGVPMMKWLIDFLLVRGINHFVPHAFSPFYPNPDCPPHFGSEGNDPQFDAFSELMQYTNRATHLLSGGVHQADVAILYHGEAEWMNGIKDSMLTQEVAKLLYDNHIDFDILPFDAINKSIKTSDGSLFLGEEEYLALIIPWAKLLPKKILGRLKELKENGVRIIFINDMPENIDWQGEVVGLNKIVNYIHNKNMAKILFDYPSLIRHYYIKRDKSHVFMLFNESITDNGKVMFTFPCHGSYLRIKPLFNSYINEYTEDGRVFVNLSPYESEFIIFGDIDDYQLYIGNSFIKENKKWKEPLEIKPKWSISLKEININEKFIYYKDTEKLFSITSIKELPNFSGEILYTGEFSCIETGDILLDLGCVGQTVQVILNGKDIGKRICRPYSYEIKRESLKDINKIEIYVSNTLVHRLKDSFSRYIGILPSGLIGPVTISSENLFKE